MKKLLNCVPSLTDITSRRTCLITLFPAVSLLCLAFFIGSAFLSTDYREKLGFSIANGDLVANKCENQCRPNGTETLPGGIIARTSNLEMRPLWGSPKQKSNSSANLFAVAVGLKQKELVNKMVKKFLLRDFVVMLFHYDGHVDKWRELDWGDRVIHVSAVNQTKWWFAKRFLHPEIVAEYDYIFLWDEDLGVEYFDPKRYISIVRDEGLEISQPGLDATKSEVHHRITVRGRRTKVHRRAYRSGANGLVCDGNSKAPPCTGWIEMMAPVFSRAAWRCVWHMIQNDLIHGWGLDMQLGYCAQGDRTQNVGVVDSEYIIHHGLPTLGSSDVNKTNSLAEEAQPPKTIPAPSNSHATDYRYGIRAQSYMEMEIFKKRWEKAVAEDECWIDPTQIQLNQTTT